MPEERAPLTVDGLARPPEAELGMELHFCPIRGLPIVRSQRVRALPGFHLLSLDAGKEPLARGSYQAFGQQFPCQNLEYLHADDKVFICAEDHKAFLNQMSMQYHRYIRHELEERKAERKRLRARAQERAVRSERHAAQAHQRQQQQTQAAPQRQQPPAAQPQQQARLPVAELESSEAAMLIGADLATHASVPSVLASNEAEAEDDDDEMEDPYAEPAIVADPYLQGGPAVATTAVDANASGAASQAAAIKRVAGALARAADKLPADDVAISMVGAESAAEELADLYGDIEDDQAKRQKTASDYASTIGAIMDDFDEDE